MGSFVFAVECGDCVCEGNEDYVNCEEDCLYPVCGNGVVEVGEVCDDGTMNSDVAADGCRNDCRDAWCGDGVVDSGEECDEGGSNSDTISSRCREDCSLPYCGDGIVDDEDSTWPYNPFNEDCDDANNNEQDGCTGLCESCIAITNDLVISETLEVPICESTYNLNDNGNEGILIIEGFDVTVDCNNALISGNGNGVGIKVIGDSVVLKNCNVEDYDTGILVQGNGLTLVESSSCNSDIDIYSEMFYNYGVENTCDETVNWYERSPGCSTHCDGTRNWYQVVGLDAACVLSNSVPVVESAVTEKTLFEGFLNFFGIGEENEQVSNSFDYKDYGELEVPLESEDDELLEEDVPMLEEKDVEGTGEPEEEVPENVMPEIVGEVVIEPELINGNEEEDESGIIGDSGLEDEAGIIGDSGLEDEILDERVIEREMVSEEPQVVNTTREVEIPQFYYIPEQTRR